ncbi:putative LPS assembly protein LptD [Flavobacterium rhizosphaerae]|uniref:LPS assembly protein LptD n=1 Tax=Flavobacterium rhizosphaerae TaxID=3163298 RepID=A0ABW8YVV8_9FLAO
MTLQKKATFFTKLALKALRTNLFHIVLSAIFLTFGSFKISAQEIGSKTTPKISSEQKTDSLPPDGNAVQAITDTLQKGDEVNVIVQDTNKNKKSGIDAQVRRVAKSYEKLDQKKKELTLYDEAELYYKDIELKAGIIIFNYDKSEVFAGRIKDSLGNYTQYPYFKQGDNIVEADSIHFNTVTKKARVWNSRSDQGEFRVKAEVTKKENDSVIYMKTVRFTTSKDVDNPEYYFETQKAKFVPGKKVVVGPTHMVIADVPTPLVLPFAFFPMTKEAESGFIVPTFGDNNNQGYFLQNGGYYFALSDYYNLTVLGDYYTNGSYGLRFQSDYANRYKYHGNININFENIINGERGFPNYSKANNYNIQWSHSKDAKANPSSNFSASVNLGSSKYFRQSQNLSNIGSSLNNNMTSSISYSKTIPTVPQVNFTLAATHSQSTNTEVINMTLPTLTLNVDRIFPFAPADAPKKGIIKNLNLQYTLTGKNTVTTTETDFFKPEMFDAMKSGLQHRIPISTNFKVFKYFSVSAGTSFEENWVFNTIRRQYTDSLVTRDVKGFDSYRTYNFTSSIGTTIYGTFKFGDDKKIQAIRHVIRPSVSYSYTPAFDQYWDEYQYDATGAMREYTRFEGGLFGSPGQNYANSIGIGVNNTFEAKVRNDDEDAKEPKKVMLLNNLNLQTSYNMAADSLAWSPLTISAGTNLFKEKMNINFNTALDPYAIDNSGRRIDTYNIDNGGSLFRLTRANVTVNYSVTSDKGKSGEGHDEDSQTARNGGREDDLFGRANDLSDSSRSMFDEDDESVSDESAGGFYNAKLPWDLRFAYALTYSNNNRQQEITGNSLMFSGNIDITPRWKVGISSGYDFVQKGVTFTQLRFERDLLSWRMNFNWVPFGTNTSWGFFIGIKSSVLSDIKYDKQRVPDRILTN